MLLRPRAWFLILGAFRSVADELNLIGLTAPKRSLLTPLLLQIRRKLRARLDQLQKTSNLHFLSRHRQSTGFNSQAN